MYPMPKLSVIFYRLFFITLAILFVLDARGLFFIDQGDFDRIAWYFFEKPLDSNHRIWQFKTTFEEMRFDIPGLIFGIYANFQKLYWLEYNLAFSAVAGQLAMLAYAHTLSKKISALSSFSMAERTALVLIFAGSFFYSHNIAMLNSFYGEYVFMLALPLLILGVISLEDPEQSAKGYMLVLLGGFFMGMAKTQFFYIPTLIGLTFILSNLVEKKKINYKFAAALVIVQILCFIPLKKNDFAQLNYYHSLYFGSYLMLDNSELSKLELPLESRKCIGTDAWGNRISGSKGEKIESGGKTCYKNQEIKISDVLAPYVFFPFTMLEMIGYSEAHWGSVRYFHVYPDSYYLKSTLGSVDSKNILVRLSLIRNRIFSGYVLVLMACLGIASIFWRRLDGFIRYTSFFLGSLFLSQLLVSILGEGVRDLGKHMWAAQFSMDVMLALWFSLLVKKLFQRSAVA